MREIAEHFASEDRPVHFIASDSNIAGSVLLGCEQGDAPFVITTADNVLIKQDSIDGVMNAMAAGADAVAALAIKVDVRSVHPAAQRFFYEFRDNGYANCNLYGIADRQALNAVEIFREGGQFMNHPRRLVNAFGLFNILLMRFGWVTVDNAFQRMSKRFGITMRRAPISDGTQAIDVDNDRTYRIVEAVLQNRIDDLKI